jgi:hypothetical protein
MQYGRLNERLVNRITHLYIMHKNTQISRMMMIITYATAWYIMMLLVSFSSWCSSGNEPIEINSEEDR